MSSAYVHFRERDDEDTYATPYDPLTAHPRTPEMLWDAIGWNRQKSANLAADIERGAYQRKGWFGTSNADKAARMPGQFDRNNYVSVQERINRFRKEHPGGAIVTTLMSLPDDATFCRYKAEVYRDIADPLPASTGFATEQAGTSPRDGANFGSHEENCETSAIGRALANFGYATSKDDRPSAEEIDKVNRRQDAPVTRSEPRGDASFPASGGTPPKEQPKSTRSGNVIPKDEQAALVGVSNSESDWLTKIHDAATMKDVEAVRAELTNANVISAPVWEAFGKRRAAIGSTR